MLRARGRPRFPPGEDLLRFGAAGLAVASSGAGVVAAVVADAVAICRAAAIFWASSIFFYVEAANVLAAAAAVASATAVARRGSPKGIKRADAAEMLDEGGRPRVSRAAVLAERGKVPRAPQFVFGKSRYTRACCCCGCCYCYWYCTKGVAQGYRSADVC